MNLYLLVLLQDGLNFSPSSLQIYSLSSSLWEENEACKWNKINGITIKGTINSLKRKGRGHGTHFLLLKDTNSKAIELLKHTLKFFQ